MGDNADSQLLLLTDTPYARIKVNYGGADAVREPFEVDAESFIAVKGFKAKGKRLTTCNVAGVEELEPLRQPEETDGETEPTDEDLTPDATPQPDNDTQEPSRQDILDEITGQGRLFDD